MTPSTPEEPEVPSFPFIPEEPEVPSFPFIPEVPEVPFIPEVPSIPEEPEVPEVVTAVEGNIISKLPLPLLLTIAPPLNVMLLTSLIVANPTGVIEIPCGDE